MSESPSEADPVAIPPPAVPTVGPVAGLPDVIRCSVCEQPLLRVKYDAVPRSIMVQCRHCGALQHRHL
jgi:hypothetical protein